MSIFNNRRLTNDVFKLDIERMRRGWYSDKYFENVGHMLTQLAQQGYRLESTTSNMPGMKGNSVNVGDLPVEMQYFNRRSPRTLIAGVDKALCMLKHCSGYFTGSDEFVSTWSQMEVEAVHDGVFVEYNGSPLDIKPVLKVRGVYRHFALLETPTLGILSRASRIATNVYDTLVAARGKPILFFPARFDVHEVQAADGYAYNIAVKRYNLDFHNNLTSFVSTDAQGDWWGGPGGGTVPHAVIACFLADTTEAMLVFAATQPVNVPRIALVDFTNDCVGTSVRVAEAMFNRWLGLMQAGDETEAEKFKLFGVRLDTGGSMRDVSIEPLGDPDLDFGVNPRLVVAVRKALDNAWDSWNVPKGWAESAREYAQGIRIVVSGGFNPSKISLFEKLGVPVDIYGVGSSLMLNNKRTNTDYSADVVRVQIDEKWVDMAKVGRRVRDNKDLLPIPADYVERQDAVS